MHHWLIQHEGANVCFLLRTQELPALKEELDESFSSPVGDEKVEGASHMQFSRPIGSDGTYECMFV